MSKTGKTIEIGETVKYDGVKLICVEARNKNCRGCYFRKNDIDCNLFTKKHPCIRCDRADDRTVKYKRGE